MKKFILILSTISTLALVGCSAKENIIDSNLGENFDSNTNTDISIDVNESQNDDELIQDENADDTILNALKDSDWVKENVTMKETCFGEEFTSEQKLTFEKLSNDLVIVQAYSYEMNNNFGVQIFLVGYKDGELQVLSMPNNQPAHPGHEGYEIDSENLILRSFWAHQGGVNCVYYKISNLALEEIDSLKFESESEYDEEKLNNFLKTYNTHTIDNSLDTDELDRAFGKNENIEIKEEDTIEDTIKNLFFAKLKALDNNNPEKLLDYRVDKVEVLSDSEKQAIIELGYNSNDILANVIYSVKPKNVNTSAWIAGNGEIEGEWIVNKIACECLRNGEFVNNTSLNTGW